MYIESLRLYNVRRFSDLAIRFCNSPGNRLTVFVAKNGEGKTTVLDAIGIALGPFISRMPHSSGSGFSVSDCQMTTMPSGKDEKLGNAALEALLFWENANHHIRRALTASLKKPTTTIRDARPLITYAETLRDRPTQNSLYPILAYYGENRLGPLTNLTAGRKHAIFSRSRIYGYAESMNPASGYSEAAYWLYKVQRVLFEERTKRDRGESHDERKIHVYENAWNIVHNAVDRILAPAGASDLGFDSAHDTLTVKDNHNNFRVRLSGLSAGVKITLGVVADIAYRCWQLNADVSENVLQDTPGIILIDEVELHLHPAWQQQILPLLLETFPSIQFIVTTHSPHVISAVNQESIRVLDGDSVRSIPEQTRGSDAQRVLAVVFDTSPVDEALPERQAYTRYCALVAQQLDSGPEGTRLREELLAHFGETHPLMVEVDMHRRYLERGGHA